jgi:hypothetical protein
MANRSRRPLQEDHTEDDLRLQVRNARLNAIKLAHERLKAREAPKSDKSRDEAAAEVEHGHPANEDTERTPAPPEVAEAARAALARGDSPLGKLADQLPETSRERAKHKPKRSPLVGAPESIIQMNKEAKCGVLKLTSNDPKAKDDEARGVLKYPGEQVSWYLTVGVIKEIPQQLETLATQPTFLWEHLQQVCSATQSLNDEARRLVEFCIVNCWIEIARSTFWNKRLGLKTVKGRAKQKAWSASDAVDLSRQVASSARRLVRNHQAGNSNDRVAANARRLISSLDAHRDLLGVPCTAYWTAKDFEKTGIDPAQDLRITNLNAPPLKMLLYELEERANDPSGPHRYLLALPNTKYWRAKYFESTGIDPRNPLLKKSPPLWVLLEALANSADEIADSYHSGKRAKVSRSEAAQALFLHRICDYLDSRFPGATYYAISQIANEFIQSAFPDHNFYDRAISYLKDLRKGVRHKNST